MFLRFIIPFKYCHKKQIQDVKSGKQKGREVELVLLNKRLGVLLIQMSTQRTKKCGGPPIY